MTPPTTELAALEQQAMQDYLADVLLPEGWTENAGAWGTVSYLDDELNERVIVGNGGFSIASKTTHWPAIPRAVLVRAAVQCGRLREAGRS